MVLSAGTEELRLSHTCLWLNLVCHCITFTLPCCLQKGKGQPSTHYKWASATNNNSNENNISNCSPDIGRSLTGDVTSAQETGESNGIMFFLRSKSSTTFVIIWHLFPSPEMGIPSVSTTGWIHGQGVFTSSLIDSSIVACLSLTMELPNHPFQHRQL